MNSRACFVAIVAAGLTLGMPAASNARTTTSFPMKATEYRKLVERRVESVWETIDKKLEHNRVSPERKKEIRHLLDDSAKGMWLEVDRASADGTVTRDEAERVRVLADGLRGQLRKRLAEEKKAQSQGQGQKAQTPSAEPIEDKTRIKRTANGKDSAATSKNSQAKNSHSGDGPSTQVGPKPRSRRASSASPPADESGE